MVNLRDILPKERAILAEGVIVRDSTQAVITYKAQDGRIYYVETGLVKAVSILSEVCDPILVRWLVCERHRFTGDYSTSQDHALLSLYCPKEKLF